MGLYKNGKPVTEIKTAPPEPVKESRLSRRGRKLIAAGALVAAGAAASFGIALGVKHNHAQEAKKQAELEQVIEPELKTIGHRALDAYLQNPKSGAISESTPKAGEVQLLSSAYDSKTKGYDSLTVIMRTKADGTPDADKTIFASGRQSTDSDHASSFELAAPDGASNAGSYEARTHKRWYAMKDTPSADTAKDPVGSHPFTDTLTTSGFHNLDTDKPYTPVDAAHEAVDSADEQAKAIVRTLDEQK